MPVWTSPSSTIECGIERRSRTRARRSRSPTPRSRRSASGSARARPATSRRSSSRPIAESLTHHHGNPAKLSLAEFVERIQDHDEVDADLADRDERIAAVLGTLAEATDEEFGDLRDQLPSEFEELIESAKTERELES